MKKVFGKILIGVASICIATLGIIYLQNKTEKPQQSKVYATDNQLSKDVWRVKHYRFNNDHTKGNCEQEMNTMVGMSGNIYWKSLGLISRNDNIARVQVYIIRNMKNGSFKKVKMFYLLNRITGLVQLEKIISNNKELNSSEIFIELLTMKTDQS